MDDYKVAGSWDIFISQAHTKFQRAFPGHPAWHVNIRKLMTMPSDGSSPSRRKWCEGRSMFRQAVRKEGRENLHLQILILDQYVDSIRYEYGRIPRY